MDVHLKQYEEAKKQGNVIIHPNKCKEGFFQTTCLNIGVGGATHGQIPDIKYFEPDAVKKEFNADWGATAFVHLGKEFGHNYKICMVYMIHKDDIGDAYVFLLGNDKETISQYMKPQIFYALRFK